MELGLRHYTRRDLEAARAAGQRLDIRVLGLASIAADVPPELARAAIGSISVLGALQASAAVKAALADRILDAAAALTPPRHPHPRNGTRGTTAHRGRADARPWPEGTIMTATLPPHMLEAARLTRLGRLAEATALLQGTLRHGDAAPPGPPPASGRPRPVIDVTPEPGEGTAPTPSPVPRGKGPGGVLNGLFPSPAQPALAGLDRMHGGAGFSAPRPRQAPLPEHARFIEGSFTGPAGTRPYKLYIPGTHRGEAMPLVVMLHGLHHSRPTTSPPAPA